MESTPRSSITVFIIIIAVILATVVSLGLFYLQSRPDPGAETAVIEEQPQEEQANIVNVEGVEIALNPVNEFLLLPPAPALEAAPENAEQQEEQQEQQEEQQQEQQQEEEQQEQQQEQQQEEEQQEEQPILQPAATDKEILYDYTAQDNDSLYNITRQLATSITLMAIYGISQDDLVVGTVINIPIGNPSYCPGQFPYAVGEGDTVFSISQKRNTTPDNLRIINNLDENFSIFAGDVICVP